MTAEFIRGTMTVQVHNIDQAQPMIFKDVDNTYIKEGFYCIVNRKRNAVTKFPIARIFRIVEPYEVGVSEGTVTGDAGQYQSE